MTAHYMKQGFDWSKFLFWLFAAQLILFFAGQSVRKLDTAAKTIRCFVPTILRIQVITITLIIMHYIYIVGTNLPMSRKKRARAVPSFKKKIKPLFFSEDKKIIAISDPHIGSPYSNPTAIISIIKTEDPDIFVILGDLFDPNEKPPYFFRRLRTDEKKVLRYLREFNKDPKKNLIIIKGDHDSWLSPYANRNPMRTKIYEKVIIHLGKHKILATHADEYDKNKSHNGTMLKKMIEPAFDFLVWLKNEHDSIIAGALLSEVSRHKHFRKILKWSKRVALNEAASLGCSMVIVGHFHFKHKFRGHRKVDGTRRWIRYVMLRGTLDAPNQYMHIGRHGKGVAVGIKSLRKTKNLKG